MSEVVCHSCGYEWTYNGDMKRATCPSCNLKTLADADSDE